MLLQMLAAKALGFAVVPSVVHQLKPILHAAILLYLVEGYQ